MWILVMYIYAGSMFGPEAVTVTGVPGFVSEQSCETAGKKGNKLVADTSKSYRYICVKQ